MDGVTAPVLHNNVPVNPSAVRVELPQSSTTAIVGVATTEFNGAANPLPVSLVHPLTV